MKHIQLFIFAITLLLACPALSASEQDTYEIFKQGLSFEKELYMFEAKDLFKKAIALEPGNKGYMEHYAWMLNNNGFHEEAADVFIKLIPLSEEKTSAYQGLGWNNRVIGRLSESIAAYQQIYTLQTPDSVYLPLVFNEIDRNLYHENEVKKSMLEKKLLENPSHTELKKELFQVYISQDKLSQAILLAESIIKTHPEDREFYLKYARALSWHNKKDEAEASLKKLLETTPDNAFLYFELGRLFHQTNQLEKAQNALETSLTLYPSSIMTKKELAEVLAKTGRHKEALALALNITYTDGEKLDSLLTKARVFHFISRLDDARMIYQQILQDYPYNTDALWGLAETSIYTGDFESAQSAIKTYEKATPDNRSLHLQDLFTHYVSPEIELKTEYYSNSSDFTRINEGIDAECYAGYGARLNIGYYASHFKQDGFKNFSRQSLVAKGVKQISETTSISGSLGGNFYNNHTNNLNARASLYLKPAKALKTALSYEHIDIIDTENPFGNSIYNYVVTIGAVGRNIKTDDYSLYLLIEPLSKLYFSGKGTWGDYSDGNRKLSALLETGYLFMSKPYVRASYNYFYLDYQDPGPVYTGRTLSETAYYDPINFETHTLRLELKHYLSKAVSFGVEGTISYIPKSSGIAHSVFCFGALQFHNHHKLQLDTRWFYQNKGVDRYGVSGYFRAVNMILSYQYKF
jgi:tetratricopeptide (TPR) repeat protein